MDDGARVVLEVADGVATVRLNRPEKLNALDAAMFEALVGVGTGLVDRDRRRRGRAVRRRPGLLRRARPRPVRGDGRRRLAAGAGSPPAAGPGSGDGAAGGPRVVPRARAGGRGRARGGVRKELALTGRTVDGTEAVRLGLATREAADPLAEATALASEIAGHSRGATRHVKRLMEMAGRVPLAEGLEAEQVALHELVGSEELVAVVRRRLAARQG